MIVRTLLLLSSLTHLTTIHALSSRIILDQQCPPEDLFHETYLQTCHDKSREFLVSNQHKVDPKPNYAPWSYPPTCTHMVTSINSILCTYISTTFGNGRGISIFTTPDIAKKFATLPAFTNQSALDALAINFHTNTYLATTIPGKGLGMLATRPLSFGDIITAYTPAFLALLEEELPTQEREMWWRHALQQLPAKTREGFYELSYVYGDERVRAQDIVKGNTFQVEVDGGNHLAVWPETSRANHECRPNAQYVIDPELLTHTVRATRDIAEGEEITIAYTSPLEPIARRQEHLQQGFHFTCTCPRCTNPQSDTTLSTMHSIQAQLNDWSRSSRGSPILAEQLITMYKSEGLEGFLDVPYGFAALAYNAAGRSKEARKYAEKAKEMILMKDGKWSENLKIWEEMLGSVRGHWSFRRRL